MTKNAKLPQVSDFMRVMERIAPASLAEQWDSVGLQIGDPNKRALRVMVALEATPAVVDEAIAREAGLLITHHPLLFKPVSTLAETSPETRLIAKLIRSGIALYAAHTNLDAAPGGTSQAMCDAVGIAHEGVLFPGPDPDSNVKFCVFTPASHIDAVIDAMASTGAGVIGDYTHCTFRSPGIGTFIPGEGANPYLGERGRLEQADDEVRLETVCPRRRIGALVAAVRAAHPYEEPAFDIYPLENPSSGKHGFGAVGTLSKAESLAAFAESCKSAFGVSSVGVVGDPTKDIQRVAVFSGSGGEAARRWRTSLADVLVTGEMTHHHAADLLARGGAAVLVGHHASEVIVCELLAKRLAEAPELEEFEFEVLVSDHDQAPVRRI